MRGTKKTCATLLGLIAFAAVCGSSNAGDDDQRAGQRSAREQDALTNGTRLYEVTETVHFGANGMTVTSRDAVAILMGFAPVGTPLCPAEALVTNPAARTCTVTGRGQDSVSLATGTGDVWGTFAVVVNAPGNSAVHVPDLPLMTGTFKGTNDLSPAVLRGVPLGSIRGTFVIDNDPSKTPIPFTGTFRLPFALDLTGGVKEPENEQEDAYYLSDDGTLTRVRSYERSLGFPSVRLEVKF